MSRNTGRGQILLIGKGERVGVPKKYDEGGRTFSILGPAWAAAVPSLFAPAMPQPSCKLHIKSGEFVGLYRQIPLKGKAPRFATPNFIFATQNSRHSKRPVETVTPLAIALNLPLNDGFHATDAAIRQMTNALLDQ